MISTMLKHVPSPSVKNHSDQSMRTGEHIWTAILIVRKLSNLTTSPTWKEKNHQTKMWQAMSKSVLQPFRRVNRSLRSMCGLPLNKAHKLILMTSDITTSWWSIQRQAFKQTSPSERVLSRQPQWNFCASEAISSEEKMLRIRTKSLKRPLWWNDNVKSKKDRHHSWRGSSKMLTNPLNKWTESSRIHGRTWRRM